MVVLKIYSRRVIFLVIAIVLTSVLSTSGTSHEASGTLILEDAFTNVANGWVRVERWRDTDPHFAQEDFPPDGRGDHDGQRVLFFGTSRPHSSRFLAGIPASVKTYLLSGGAANIPGIHNEHTGPSDGIVFVASSSSPTGIGAVGGNVILPSLNHLETTWANMAMAQIEAWLQ